MSNLYNQERPKDFSHVVGQQVTISVLSKQLVQNKIHHAYLFEGHHGSGKTTIAKIFSNAVNCEHPTENGPCMECEACKNSSNSMDILEMDAASNNSVEDIRRIVEFSQYRPVNAKYKVLIIDEVHMLSRAAFDALLKTLEEPPEYMIFILCTTEKHKIPATIVSRCQKFTFDGIDEKLMMEHLKNVCEKYGHSYEEEALYHIVRAAKGSMRDALGLLETLFQMGVTGKNAVSMLGLADESVMFALLGSIHSNNYTACMEHLDAILKSGQSTRLILDRCIEIMSDVCLYQTTSNMELIINTEYYRGEIEKLSQMFTIEQIFSIIERMASERNNMLAHSCDISFRTLFLSICHWKEEINRLDELELKVTSLQKELDIMKMNKITSNETALGNTMKKNTDVTMTSESEQNKANALNEENVSESKTVEETLNQMSGEQSTSVMNEHELSDEEFFANCNPDDFMEPREECEPAQNDIEMFTDKDKNSPETMKADGDNETNDDKTQIAKASDEQEMVDGYIVGESIDLGFNMEESEDEMISKNTEETENQLSDDADKELQSINLEDVFADMLFPGEWE